MKLKIKNFLRKLFTYMGYEIKRNTQDVQFDFYSIFLGINSISSTNFDNPNWRERRENK